MDLPSLILVQTVMIAGIVVKSLVRVLAPVLALQHVRGVLLADRLAMDVQADVCTAVVVLVPMVAVPDVQAVAVPDVHHHVAEDAHLHVAEDVPVDVPEALQDNAVLALKHAEQVVQQHAPIHVVAHVIVHAREVA